VIWPRWILLQGLYREICGAGRYHGGGGGNAICRIPVAQRSL